MTEPTGRHRAPEPTPAPPARTAGDVGFNVLITMLLAALVVGVVVGALGGMVGWGVAVFCAGMIGLLSYGARGAKPHPRLRREAAYAGRTAERATIWWAVFRLLNGVFR